MRRQRFQVGGGGDGLSCDGRCNTRHLQNIVRVTKRLWRTRSAVNPTITRARTHYGFALLLLLYKRRLLYNRA